MMALENIKLLTSQSSRNNLHLPTASASEVTAQDRKWHAHGHCMSQQQSWRTGPQALFPSFKPLLLKQKVTQYRRITHKAYNKMGARTHESQKRQLELFLNCLLQGTENKYVWRVLNWQKE